MVDRITVTSDELRSLGDQANKAGTNIGNELRTLMGRVEAVGSTWTGTASAAFNNYARQFNQGWSQCEEALSQIAQMRRGSAEAYDQTEQGIAGQFAG